LLSLDELGTTDATRKVLAQPTAIILVRPFSKVNTEQLEENKCPQAKRGYLADLPATDASGLIFSSRLLATTIQITILTRQDKRLPAPAPILLK